MAEITRCTNDAARPNAIGWNYMPHGREQPILTPSDASLILGDKYPATDPMTLPPVPQNGHPKTRNHRSDDLRRCLVSRFRKPMLYPLSYEGASHQGTCLRSVAVDRER
jgi:hypothetical protein